MSELSSWRTYGLTSIVRSKTERGSAHRNIDDGRRWHARIQTRRQSAYWSQSLKQGKSKERAQSFAYWSKERGKARSGGVAFYIRNDLNYTPVEFVSNIECSIIKMNYNDKDINLFWVIYWPDTYKLTCNLKICFFSLSPWSTSRSYLETSILTHRNMKQMKTDMKTFWMHMTLQYNTQSHGVSRQHLRHV